MILEIKIIIRPTRVSAVFASPSGSGKIVAGADTLIELLESLPNRIKRISGYKL